MILLIWYVLSSQTTRSICEAAKGKVLFIDEAYNLDPTRANNSYGNEVIDTLVECVEGNAGSDMCVILAGYKPQMEDMIRNCNNRKSHELRIHSIKL